jgi:23S rRNA pseudouridine2605 synthase
VTVNGRPVDLASPRVYLMLNKPPGYVCTRRDPRARRTVMELVGDRWPSVYPVGRLDKDTEGLLLLTNDGDFAFRMTHPRFEVQKVYRAEVEGAPTPASLRRLARGIELEDGRTAPAQARVLRVDGPLATIELTIREGRKREVRRMLQAVGSRVVRLRRVQLGGLTLGSLLPGEVRALSAREVAALLAEAGSRTP